MSKRADILLVGQTPPPLHGQAVITAMLFEHDWPEMNVERLRMAFSDDVESVGEASWIKVWKLFCLIIATWKMVIKCRPKVLYYLPASPNMTPVIRDVIYLLCVRWLFPKTIFHYHAGGLGQFVGQKKIIKQLGGIVYGKADCSIDVNITTPPSGEWFSARENRVVMNGLDVGSAQRQRPKDSTLRLLYVGMLCEEKGVLNLIELAKILQEQGHAVEFQMVGGWESAEIKLQFEKDSQEAEVLGMFQFTGPLSGDAKWQAYADTDIFLFPTHHPTETFGLVLIEAMAFGLPIVTNRWRGVPHVIGDSGCAEMCEVHSMESFSSSVKKLIGAPQLRISMGKAGVQHYQQNFTKEVFLSRMEKVFRDTLHNIVES